MLSSFSLGLTRVITDKTTDRSLVKAFSLGLERTASEKDSVSRVLLDAFSVGLSEGSWDIRIYRHRR